MSDDDDWFERAFEDEDKGAAENEDGDEDATGGALEADEAGTGDDDGGTQNPTEAESGRGAGDEKPAARGTKDGEAPAADRSAGEPSSAESVGETAVDTDEGAGQPEPTDSAPTPTEQSGESDSPFEEDFAAALQNAPEPGAGGGPGAGQAQGPGAPAVGPEQGSESGDQGSPFGPTDGADEEFGFADFDGDSADFDEESFESDLERVDIGIEGLDQMILGGVPRRSLMVAIGSAGTGKTTFGLQFLNHGLAHGEDAVYIALEESQERILDTAAEKGWEFERYVAEDRLAIVDIDPIEMANSLDSIQSDLPALIEEFGADRLVLDSVSLLEMMYESAPERRSQVFGFTRALKRAGITTLMTSEASDDNPYASRFGIVEYLADAVFVLQYVRPSDFRETRLAIEIQKIRDANHSRETKPYELTTDGISVYRQANIF